MKLPDSLRDQMKIPMGDLIPESQVNSSNIQKHLQKNSYLITVGDRTTEKMISFGIVPSLQIIDNYEKRVKREPTKSTIQYTELTCDNPAAQITPASIDIIKKALTSKTPVKLTVVGEEDLLVIPV